MATIQDNTQTDFDNAEAVVIDMLQTSHPGISLRRGTVLRELLVRPAAEVYAACSNRLDESMRCRSLELLKESGKATNEEIDAILSNFSMSLYTGRNASGLLFVQVSEDMSYGIPADTVFTSPDGLRFVLAHSYVATSADVSGDAYLKLKQTENGSWYFLLPVEAESPGSEYELEPGVRFDTSFEFSGLVGITSYVKFSGGVDAQTVDDAISKLETAVSVRGFDSRTAIVSTLLDRNCGNFSGIVRSCGIAGYGDAEQIRDKANVFGIATGGKVDLFVRSFDAPSVVTLPKAGVWSSEHNAWLIRLTHDEIPGYYSVRSVTASNVQPAFGLSGGDSLVSSGSLPVEEAFDVSSDVPPFHFLPPDPRGAAWTSWRNVTLLVGNGDSDTVPEDGESKGFSVAVYASPAIAAVQEYVDRVDVRTLKNDMVVRAAPVCLVSISACVGVSAGSPAPDLSAMRSAVAAYVNSRSFVPRLTASEIVAVLKEFGISRVEMMHGRPGGFRMEGRIRKASGEVVRLHGPDLDVAAFADPANLVTPNTVCFGANLEDVSITAVSDK